MENEKEKTSLTEEIKNVGKIIVGELEAVGGIITGDSLARAEGDLRADEGIIREKAIHDLPEEKKEEN